jgi:hypothetical protein
MRRISILIFFLAIAFTGWAQNINKKTHNLYPWKVHEISEDFELLDVWEIPILADKTKNQDFSLFLKVMQQSYKPSVHNYFSLKYLIARSLALLRVFLGETFGLDQNINSLPIPGCIETSLKDRLSAEDRKRSLAEVSAEGAPDEDSWRIVYLYEDEILIELSNNTVHALMHGGWVHKSGNYFTARLAVYAKPRGTMGELYMKLIMPFRHAIVYPVMMEEVKKRWYAHDKISRQ